jgi:hypothetical protein
MVIRDLVSSCAIVRLVDSPLDPIRLLAPYRPAIGRPIAASG